MGTVCILTSLLPQMTKRLSFVSLPELNPSSTSDRKLAGSGNGSGRADSTTLSFLTSNESFDSAFTKIGVDPCELLDSVTLSGSNTSSSSESIKRRRLTWCLGSEIESSPLSSSNILLAYVVSLDTCVC